MKNKLKSVFSWLGSFFWHKQLEIAVVGNHFAGKTTFVQSLLSGEYEEDSIPTIGFNIREFRKGKVNLKMWDFGGQKQFQDFWETYTKNCDAILYVVDAADVDNIRQSREVLHHFMSNSSLSNIPLLILGNKTDLDCALTEEELIEYLDLRHLNHREIACFSISAKSQWNIELTYKWLANLKPQKKNK